jgi:acetyltransferase
MTVRNLDALFKPHSVAVIGASSRAGSLGAIVWQRVSTGGFPGRVWPVNPKYDALDGHAVFRDTADLPEAPSVALVCAPSAVWPDIVHKLGGLGARAAIIVGDARSAEASAAINDALVAARPHLLRIVGPGSLGVVTPSLRAQLGAASCTVKPGGVAWISQSNALTNAVLGWADARALGFSHAVALGGEADVDAGDVLDYLASDGATRAILLALGTVRAARKFMSAARAAARSKPVLVLRTGCADSADALYAAAFRRAGMVRVETLDDLLDEIETLGLGRIASSSSATLIAADRGVAALASDAFVSAGAQLARWSDDATRSLAAALPHVRPGNPVLLGDDAHAADFGRALDALAPHDDTGAAFVVHATTHRAPALEVARVLIERQRFAYRGMFACFFGTLDASTRDALRAHGIALHSTPHRLARAFARLVDYRLGRELLMQTPQGLPAQVPITLAAVQARVRAAVAAGTATFKGDEAAQLAQCFGLRVAAHVARSPDRGSTEAAETENDFDAETIVDVTVELDDDADFGPVFRFTAPPRDGLPDPFSVYGLPPLNPVLAREILAKSPYAGRVPVDPVLRALTALSEMVCAIEQIAGMTAVLRVLPTRVVLVAPQFRLAPSRGRLAIVPYPRALEETLDWRGQRLTIRPIRPEDEAAHRAFVEAMSPDDLRLRFFAAVRGFDHSQLARMTQIDYDREMALIVTQIDANGDAQTFGVVRAIADPDNECAEFAVAVRSDMKGKGLGKLLMARIIDYARARGTRFLTGEILRENAAMLALAKGSGFEMLASDDPAIVSVRLAL